MAIPHINNNNRCSAEEDDSKIAAVNQDFFIPTGSLVYRMYKCVFQADETATTTSSEMTSDCSSDDDDDGSMQSIDDDAEFAVPSSSSPPSSPSSHNNDFLSAPLSSLTSTPTIPHDLLSSNDIQQDWKTFAPTYDALLLQELSDRASVLLQRESSRDYMVLNYFQRRHGCDDIPKLPSLDQGSAKSSSSSNNSSESSSSSRFPVDTKCRSIMMDWSFRLLEFILPMQERHDGTPHSLQAILLVTKTFSYVDRICTKFQIVSREQYKLLTLVCLHLAAKTSGLLKLTDRVYDNVDNVECGRLSRSDDTASTTSVTTLSSCSSSSSSSTISTSDIESNDSGSKESYRSISPTPDALPSRQQQEPDCSKGYIWLLSTHGLQSLCNGEFSMEQFTHMEYTILHGLNWRLTSVLALDWIDVYLELMMLQHPPALPLRRDESVNSSNNQNIKAKCVLSFSREECDSIRDATLIQLEHALKQPCFMTVAPSLLGLAALLNAMASRIDCSHLLDSSIEEALGVRVDEDELEDVRMKMMSEVA